MSDPCCDGTYLPGTTVHRKTPNDVVSTRHDSQFWSDVENDTSLLHPNGYLVCSLRTASPFVLGLDDGSCGNPPFLDSIRRSDPGFHSPTDSPRPSDELGLQHERRARYHSEGTTDESSFLHSADFISLLSNEEWRLGLPFRAVSLLAPSISPAPLLDSHEPPRDPSVSLSPTATQSISSRRVFSSLSLRRHSVPLRSFLLLECRSS